MNNQYRYTVCFVSPLGDRKATHFCWLRYAIAFLWDLWDINRIHALVLHYGTTKLVEQS